MQEEVFPMEDGSESSLLSQRRRRRRWMPPPQPPPSLQDMREAEGGRESDDVGNSDVKAAVTGQVAEGVDQLGCSGRMDEVDRSLLPCCPICMEKWTAEGSHRVCCTPCGHVYGKSCLLKWVKQCGKNPVKCPQCNKKFKQKQIINLYAPLVAIAADDLEKEINHLRVKNEMLVVENSHLLDQVQRHQMQILQLENYGRKYLAEGICQSPSLAFNGMQKNFTQFSSESMLSVQGHAAGGTIGCNCVLQFESELDGARVVGINPSHQIVMIARMSSTPGSAHFITKISLFVPNEMEDIRLPPSIGAVRDLHVLPTSKLALVGCMGRKLSIISMESNNVILQYDLPRQVWSCSWDASNQYIAYAGTQNGKLLVFDIRQTARPLRTNSSPCGYPIHTIQSVTNNHMLDSRTLFTASSMGIHLWNGDSVGEWPNLIPGTDSQGVCLSLACENSADFMVASFRPKVEASINNFQLTQPCSPSNFHAAGDHILFKRRGDGSFGKYEQCAGSVSEIRMSKSVVFSLNNNDKHVFAYGDEASRSLCIWDIPSFKVVQHLKPHQLPILDVKYSSGCNLLACISKTKLQVFACSDL